MLISGCTVLQTGTPEPVTDESPFSNTIWKEVCMGSEAEEAHVRFLPDGTFAWSDTGTGPGDFRHDGDDRWAVVGRTLMVRWDADRIVTRYTVSRGDVLTGRSTRACEDGARLERVSS